MKINGKQLGRQLAAGSNPLYWISGDETLLVQEAADQIRQHCRQLGSEEREVFHIGAGTDWQTVLLAANSRSLFSSRKLIELRFASGKPGDRAVKPLLRYLEAPNPDCTLLAISPKLDASALRSKGFKQLESSSLIVQIWPIEARQLPGWIARRLQQQGFDADGDALRLLAERVEGNLLAAQQEVDKLALVAEPGSTIDCSTVEQAVADSARFQIFDLSEPILRGDSRHFVRTLHGLREEGAEPTLALWAVSRDLRRLIQLRQAVARGQSAEAAMPGLGIWKQQQAPFKSALRRLSAADLASALRIAGAVDLAIKGLNTRDPWRELLDLGLLLSGRALFR